jgi:hypothetical protein
MRMLWYIGVLVLVVFVIVYIRYYYKYPTELTILQTTLRNFSFEMLQEKQPIVVQDFVATLESLQNVWFKYNTVQPFNLSASDPENPTWIRNVYKYVVIHCSDDVEILVAHAHTKPTAEGFMPEDASIVAIQLQARQIVILPYHIHYAVCSSKKETLCSCIGVHDIVSRMLPS